MLIRRTPTSIDNIFEDWNRTLNQVNEFTGGNRNLALDVHENDDAYIITTDVPGANTDDIDIRLQDNMLTITAETSSETRQTSENALVQERRFGTFSRSLRFPEVVNGDAVEANYNDGVLTITVPKADEVKPRRITVNANRRN